MSNGWTDCGGATDVISGWQSGAPTADLGGGCSAAAGEGGSMTTAVAADSDGWGVDTTANGESAAGWQNGADAAGDTSGGWQTGGGEPPSANDDDGGGGGGGSAAVDHAAATDTIYSGWPSETNGDGDFASADNGRPPRGGGGGRRGASDQFGSGTGGGGDFGGGGGGSRACRTCGEEGHFARECPSKPALTCRKCNEEGHMARECPKDTCYGCGQPGHRKQDCTNAPAEADSDQPRPATITYVPTLDKVTDMMSELCYVNSNVQRFNDDKVTVSDPEFAVPLQSFEEAELCPLLMARIQELGYATPTPIQKYSIPIIMAGRDMIACSQTGSGKSAAFILPILQTLMNDTTVPERASLAGKRQQNPLVVVISPTRELCKQLHDHFLVLSEEQSRRIGVAQAYGGTQVMSNRSDIRCGTHVLCAVPGRLKQFVNEGTVSFEALRYLVLDEADRMLDQGFEEDINFFNKHPSMPSKENRQTLMFSATFPPNVEQLGRALMRSSHTVKVVVGTLGGVNADVAQTFVETPNFSAKREQIISILNEHPSVKKDSGVDEAARDRIIVFAEQKKIVDTIGLFLNLNGFDVTTMHGDREQREREEALKTLKQGKFPVLVATAVAARGLDIKGVTLVVNFDLPKEIDDYVHRVGRTGRVGMPGKAISFYNADTDSALAASLVQALNECGQPVPDFISAAASGGTTDAGFEGNTTEESPGWESTGDNGGWTVDENY